MAVDLMLHIKLEIWKQCKCTPGVVSGEMVGKWRLLLQGITVLNLLIYLTQY